MSDTCCVTIMVLDADAVRAETLLEAFNGNAYDQGGFDGVQTFSYEACNYGSLSCEEDLKAEGIPYSKYCEGGADYEAFEEHFRIAKDGTRIEKEWTTGHEHLLSKTAVREALEEAGIHGVFDLLAKHDAEHYLIPWDEQDEIVRSLGLRNVEEEEEE